MDDTRWRPANDQAAAFAGSVSIDVLEPHARTISMAFANGVTVWARPAPLPQSDGDVRNLVARIQTDLGAPPDMLPTLYRVDQESVATSVGGGLCGGLRTRFLALATWDGTDGAVLRLAAYHTDAPPPERPRASDLRPCFQFDFAPWES